MTKKEVAAILEVLNAAYPNFYSKSTADPKLVLDLWAQMFADDDPLQVSLAVKAIIATDASGFAPTIGAIKQRMAEQKTYGELTESEAWNLIRKAASNGYYGCVQEFEALPPILQTVVGAPSQLRDWSQMDTEVFNSVVASNFRRAFRAEVTKMREALMIPSDVQQKLQMIERKRLTDNTKEDQ